MLRCHYGSFIVRHKHFTCTITFKRLNEDFREKNYIMDAIPEKNNIHCIYLIFRYTIKNIFIISEKNVVSDKTKIITSKLNHSQH